jgi:hypothetical protein
MIHGITLKVPHFNSRDLSIIPRRDDELNWFALLVALRGELVRYLIPSFLFFDLRSLLLELSFLLLAICTCL